MNIGDKVRFLNEVGGGIVAGFQGKNIVLVEDEDGFQMPMLVNEVVVVTDEDYSTTNLVEGKNGEKPVAGSKSAARPIIPIPIPLFPSPGTCIGTRSTMIDR